MKYVAIVPSNQNGNIYTGGQYNEKLVMDLLAQEMEKRLSAGAYHVKVKVFSGTPQSLDSYSLEGLYRQQSDAVRWLRQEGAALSDALIVNIHSDSGLVSRPDYPHVGYYWGNDASRRAGKTIASALEGLMQTGTILNADYGAYVFYRVPASYGYVGVLIETGCHQSPHDLDFLLNRRPEMAEALVEGIVTHMSIPQQITVVAPEPAQVYFSTFGVPCNPDSAIYKFWKVCFDSGDFANLGPALRPEEPGDLYGKSADDRVQFFANGVVHASASEGWKCRRPLICMEPQVWFK